MPNHASVTVEGTSPAGGLHVAVVHWLLDLASRQCPAEVAAGDVLLVGPDEDLIGELGGWMDIGHAVVAEYTGPRAMNDVYEVARRAMLKPGPPTVMQSLDGALEAIRGMVPTWVVLEGTRWMRYLEKGAERADEFEARREERQAERKRQAAEARKLKKMAERSGGEGSTTEGSGAAKRAKKGKTRLGAETTDEEMAEGDVNALLLENQPEVDPDTLAYLAAQNEEATAEQEAEAQREAEAELFDPEVEEAEPTVEEPATEETPALVPPPSPEPMAPPPDTLPKPMAPHFRQSSLERWSGAASSSTSVAKPAAAFAARLDTAYAGGHCPRQSPSPARPSQEELEFRHSQQELIAQRGQAPSRSPPRRPVPRPPPTIVTAEERRLRLQAEARGATHTVVRRPGAGLQRPGGQPPQGSGRGGR